MTDRGSEIVSRQQRRAQQRAALKAERKRTTFGRGAFAVGAILAAGTASAATITVNTTADDTTGGDAKCTLREAITNANANADTTAGDCTAGAAGLDTIVFQTGLTGTITLGGTELPMITDSLTINGPVSGLLTISGNNASGIFDIMNGASTTPIDVNINHLTLTLGSTCCGGAVSDDSENLTLDHMVITANAATGNGGGVAFSDYDGATLTISNSTISGNTAGSSGAGLSVYYASGAVSITNSTISGNTAYGAGGGVYVDYLKATMSISGSTISGNTASNGPGGGVYASQTYSPLSISGSTISGNSAPNGSGGGVYASQTYSGLSITTSTLTGNLAGTVSSSAGSSGGGLEVNYAYSTVYLFNDTFGGPNPADQNKAGSDGGAVNARLSKGGSFTMKNSIVTNNQSGVLLTRSGNGGGVRVESYYSSTPALIENSVITGNVGDPNDASLTPLGGSDGYDKGYGGGLYLIGYLSAIVRGTTISGNTAYSGGGVYIGYGVQGTLENVTIAGNHAQSPVTPGLGGGVRIVSDTTSVTFNEATITNNTAQSGGGGIDAGGGTTTTLYNSIVANNVSPAVPPDITSAGTLNSSFTTVGTATLGPLADNGSIILAGNPSGTQQHPQTELPSGPTLVNAGDPAFTPPPATDERGLSRVVGGRIDQGAAEVQPTLSINNVSQNEGNAGNTPFNFTVTLSATSNQTVTVNFATADGTATQPSDYAATSGTLTFTPGTTTQPITVQVVGDTNVEPNETFTVNLSSPSANATIATASGTGTIVNDDVVVNADLSITKTASAGPYFATVPVTYTITVNNAGPASAAAVTVTDTIPAGSTFVSATPSQGTCSGNPTVTCNLGTIASGGSATIALKVTPTAAGPMSNTATVASTQPDTNPANNQSTAVITVAPASAIPALGEWARIILALTFSLLGLLKLKRD